MIAHLVSCNEYTSEKFILPLGKTVIGRGPLLKVADTRISRSHAVIINSEDKLLLKSLCKNPTYYCPPGLNEFIPLKYNEECVLADAGKISFLSDDFIFQIVINAEVVDDPEGSSQSCVQQSTFQSSASANLNVCDVSSRKRVLPQWMTNLEGATPIKKLNKKNKTGSHNNQAKNNNSQQMDDKKSDVQPQKSNNEAQISDHPAQRRNIQMQNIDNLASIDLQDEDKHDQFKASTKRFLSESISEEAPEALIKEDVPDETQIIAAACSNLEKTNQLSTLDDDVNTLQKQNSKQICPYGLTCYRKNPLHFKEFDHLNDQLMKKNDTKAKEKPLCEYGSKCYRKNSQHWQDYKHSTSNNEKKIKPKRSKQENNPNYKENNDSDDDENKYDLDDSFIDDENSDDDYSPDSVSASDEYVDEDKDKD